MGQIWTDSTNVKRDFTFGYTWLTSDERKNKMIKDKAKVRKTLNHSENHQHGCSYGLVINKNMYTKYYVANIKLY